MKRKTKNIITVILLAIMLVIGLYASVRVIIDPDWYFGKSLVREGVSADEFWEEILK